MYLVKSQLRSDFCVSLCGFHVRAALWRLCTETQACRASRPNTHRPPTLPLTYDIWRGVNLRWVATQPLWSFSGVGLSWGTTEQPKMYIKFLTGMKNIETGTAQTVVFCRDANVFSEHTEKTFPEITTVTQHNLMSSFMRKLFSFCIRRKECPSTVG